eukprot:TRINITY_DN1298_c0_g2_i5.p1 TRINITY_DN1298_c0_g2~~TRINITY_DN1298_c0_g2_i5.p1  ORF type:complete len:529 (-),score=45.26 TRINITY_DN1298_c0_g2_i5:153-1739(-)
MFSIPKNRYCTPGLKQPYKQSLHCRPLQSPRRPQQQQCQEVDTLSQTQYGYDLYDEQDQTLQQELNRVKKQELELRKQVEQLELKVLSRRQSKLRSQLNQERGIVVDEQTNNNSEIKSVGKSKKRRKKRSSQFSAARAGLNDNSNANGSLNGATSIKPVPKSPKLVVEDLEKEFQNDPSYKTAGERVVTASHDLLENDLNDQCVLPKPIFVVSDCTGESAAHTVRAALGQFELCYQLSCPANMVIFRFQESQDSVYEIAHKAQQEDALIVYTLVNPDMVKAIKTAAKLYDVKAVDLWSNLVDNMELHLDTVRSGLPLTSPKRRTELPADYFRMIEAVEFTRKMDDGANPQNWHAADLLILGVSRSGKTPLSIYLGQRGYKTANLPLVPDCPLPKQLFEIDQEKIVGLIIDPMILSQIRTQRKGSMGVENDEMDYNDLKKVRSEITWAKSLYEQNPGWLVLDVTLRSCEETAARILRAKSAHTGNVHPLWADQYSQAKKVLSLQSQFLLCLIGYVHKKKKKKKIGRAHV